MANNIMNVEKLLGTVQRINQKKSLAYRIADKQPMTGPLGIVIGMQRDKSTDKMILKRKEVQPTSYTIKTEFTEESLQDMMGLYGEDFYEVLAYYLVDELMYDIDADFIKMLKDRAADMGTKVFNSSDFQASLYAVAQSMGMMVHAGLADLPISDNRSALGFAICSPDVAAVMALGTTLGDPNQSARQEDDAPSYMGTLAGIDWYIDYTHDGGTSDNIIFGTLGNGISKGSAIISHYTQQWVEGVNPESGEKTYHLFDRTGMTINPLDDIYMTNDAVSGFVGKIDIDLSDILNAFGFTGRVI